MIMDFELRALLQKADNGDNDARTEVLAGFVNGEYEKYDMDTICEKAIKYATEDEDFRNYLISIADMYLRGYHCEKQPEKAKRIYEIAVEAGENFGNECIGMMYYEGNGVEQDFKKAYEYFTVKDKMAFCTRYMLGEMYHLGRYVEQDDEIALKYYKLVAFEESDNKKLDNYYGPACYRAAELMEKDCNDIEVLTEAFQLITIAKETIDWSESCGWAEVKISKDDVYKLYEKIKITKEKIEHSLITPEKICRLADKYYFGDGKPVNEAKAVIYYKRADENGYWPAKMMLSICAMYGYGMEKSKETAEKYLSEAMEIIKKKMKSEDIYDATEKYISCRHLKIEEYEEARDYVWLSAKTGFPEGMYWKGYDLEERNLGKADIDWAKELYLKASALGHSGATGAYGRLCYSTDKDKGLKYLLKSASEGNVVSMVLLGDIYHNDTPYEALYWYFKAACKGNDIAQYSIGCAYDNGDGPFFKDEIAATTWYMKAAENGNAKAMFNLGVNYLHGYGGCSQDKKLAFSYFCNAAENGNANGIINMGLCYEGGIGVEKDLYKAMEIYEDLILRFDDEEVKQKAVSGIERIKECLGLLEDGEENGEKT